MKFIPFADVQIPPERQRLAFNAELLIELRESIADYGLLHPIILRDGNILVAGERRLRAIQDMRDLGETLRYGGEAVPSGLIPAVDLGDLSSLDAEAIELDENLRRVDLSWQERASAISRLAALRSAQGNSDLGDLREELGCRHDSIKQSIAIAAHLDSPDIAKATSIGDAFKILKRKEAAIKHEELSQRVGTTFSAHAHRIFNADAIEWMSAAEPNQFDCILTDPPYGMDAQKFDNAGGRYTSITHQYDDSSTNWPDLMQQFFEQSFRLAKPQAHLYVCCDIDKFDFLRVWANSAGWWVHRTPLIIHKLDGNRVPWPEHGPRRQWEMILYAVKGKRPVLTIQSDVIETRLTEESYAHAAQKPTSLYRNLLNRTCRPGDTVLDPFSGTGTIFPSAHSLQLKAVGVEKSVEYFGIGLKRLGELK